MERKDCAFVGLLIFLIGASAEIVDARLHESFSASTYYEADKNVITAPKDTKEESTVTTDLMKTDPSNRYENGYPVTRHVYNSATGRYDETFPKFASEKEMTLSSEKTSSSETTTESKVPSTSTSAQGTHQATTTFNHNIGAAKADEFTFDPVEGRYKAGYYPQSTYAGATQKTTLFRTNTGGVSLATQNTNQQMQTTASNFQNRYEKGYFPNSQYTQQGYQHTLQGPKQVTYASTNDYNGNFNTMPYPNSGIPFVASGAGCRTAYWVENPSFWPSFLKVSSPVCDAFGSQAAAKFGKTTLLEGLTEYGTDPYNHLLRSATTALLNSYTRGLFGISHMKVIEQFNTALVSKEAATTQAIAFDTENVASISAGSACT